MNNVDKWNTNEAALGIAESHTIARRQTAQLAHHLSTVAVRQWEKTLTGIVALPAAAALGVAATATFGVALLERGFEVFEAALGDVGRTLTVGNDTAGNDVVGGRERHERIVDRAPEARA
jgi:hypothetical protein